MPISDNPEYSTGHFLRVYEHIIKPACELAGFTPIRADDVMTTNYIALDIIKNIIESEMALCDLSSKNPNVLYELGIRQAFNLPVTLMKDSKTKRIFDIQGFRDIEYDESLRIDTVETTVADLAELIKNTYENKSTEINSLISLLGIEPAKVSDKKKISVDTELILNSLTSLEKRITRYESKLPENTIQHSLTALDLEFAGNTFTSKELSELKVGDEIFHIKRGKGIIKSLRQFGNTTKQVAQIKLDSGSSLQLVLDSSINTLRKVKK